MLAPGRQLEAPGLGPGNPGPELPERGGPENGPRTRFPNTLDCLGGSKTGQAFRDPPAGELAGKWGLKMRGLPLNFRTPPCGPSPRSLCAPGGRA